MKTRDIIFIALAVIFTAVIVTIIINSGLGEEEAFPYVKALIYFALSLAGIAILFFGIKYAAEWWLKKNQNGGEGPIQLVGQKKAIDIFVYNFCTEFLPVIFDYNADKDRWIRKDKPPFRLVDPSIVEFRNPRIKSEKTAGKELLILELKVNYGKKAGIHTFTLRLDEGEDYLWENPFGHWEENVGLYTSDVYNEKHPLATVKGENNRLMANMLNRDDYDAEQFGLFQKMNQTTQSESKKEQDMVVQVPQDAGVQSQMSNAALLQQDVNAYTGPKGDGE